LETCVESNPIASKTGSKRNIHYPALDGLRGIAIVLVLLYHNFNFISFFNFGWLGVDLFFVLSGFLITNQLLDNLNSKYYFSNFYIKRVLRIFPIYYLSLVLFFIIFPRIHGFPLNISFYLPHQLWYWVYLQNFSLIANHSSEATALNHFWSLAIEEQFYLLWPLFIFLIRDPKKLFCFCLVSLLAILSSRILLWMQQDILNHYNWLLLFTRVDGILIGSGLALLLKYNRKLLQRYLSGFIFLLAFLNFTFYFFNSIKALHYSPWDIVGYTTFSSLFALFIFEVIIKPKGFMSIVLSNRPFRILGKYSYGIYIFHWPVFLIMKPITDSLRCPWYMKGSLPQLLFSSLLATFTGILAGIISYHLIEVHFLKLKKRFQ
jgi:peptidoglycan/LPS O-acetylase OafA/YrhL